MLTVMLPRAAARIYSFYLRGVLYTPDLGCVLDGITRRTIIELARAELGLEVIEKRITRDQAYIADEVFFTRYCGRSHTNTQD